MRSALLVLTLMFLLPGISNSYPPAPHHLIYGQVRDELGHPIILRGAEIFLETTSGVRIKTQITPGLEPGVNYRLRVPMDSGLTSDPYRPTALRPTVPFTVRVTINGVNYLPIEMVGNYSQLGRPGEKTRLDLTLGEDSDGDGLPDAWERILLDLLGATDLSLINPDDDFDGDGISNRDEYLAGTYAFDPDDGFSLRIAGFLDETPVLEFLTIRGRTYKILGSDDLAAWTPVAFRPMGSSVPTLPEYYARDVRLLRMEAPPSDPEMPAFRFFKLMVE